MAHIKYWRLHQDNIRPVPIVNGIVHMEGEFTHDEWQRIVHMFATMRTQPIPRPTVQEAAKALGIPPDRLLDSI